MGWVFIAIYLFAVVGNSIEYLAYLLFQYDIRLGPIKYLCFLIAALSLFISHFGKIVWNGTDLRFFIYLTYVMMWLALEYFILGRWILNIDILRMLLFLPLFYFIGRLLFVIDENFSSKIYITITIISIFVVAIGVLELSLPSLFWENSDVRDYVQQRYDDSKIASNNLFRGWMVEGHKRMTSFLFDAIGLTYFFLSYVLIQAELFQRIPSREKYLSIMWSIVCIALVLVIVGKGAVFFFLLYLVGRWFSVRLAVVVSAIVIIGFTMLAYYTGREYIGTSIYFHLIGLVSIIDILSNSLVGYGFLDPNSSEMLHIALDVEYMHIENYLSLLVFQGGLIGLVAFILFFYAIYPEDNAITKKVPFISIPIYLMMVSIASYSVFSIVGFAPLLILFGYHISRYHAEKNVGTYMSSE